MSECLETEDFKALGKSMLDGFDRRVALIPPDLCGPFHQEARQLETQIMDLHNVAARCAGKSEDLELISRLWEIMVVVCHRSMERLNNLVKRHPDCGAQVYYDRLLDLRNRCARLQKMHS